MKNKYLKVLFMIIFFIAIINIKTKVQANSISSINMDIFIDNYGNANVTETWQCNTSQGTESYHPYYNLGNSSITNLTVSDKTKTYTTLGSWNTSGSLSSKAYKCGINYINNGVEICWGISSYGSNTYIVKYTITNFVSSLSDSQMVYWTLIPYDFSNSIGSVKIKIHSNKYFQDTIDVWGYGNYGGLCYVNNGAIYMDSDGRLGTSEYMTILAKFPLNTFNCENVLDYDFDHYYNMAEKGSKKYNKKSESIIGKFSSVFIYIFQFAFFIVIMIVSKITIGKKYGFKYGPLGKKIPRDVNYFRDIPCDNDIFKAYYIAYQYNIIKNKTDILGAIILKWLKKGIIKTENREGGKIFKKENTVILLGDERNRALDNTKETELFHMMYVASKDGILENKEFEIWCRKSYSKVLGWFDDILEEQRNKLYEEGLLTKQNSGVVFIDKYTATPELKNEAMKLAGLKRFLLEYTLIPDRDAIEVELFEDYLIFAQMMGIAKQVSKQFKELYPEMIEQSNYGTYDNIIYINYCSSRGIASANSARAAAQSYSSGGGGFSSGGGGGGSFGGGGGGRRLPLKNKIKKHFSDEEIKEFRETVEKGAHLFFKYAKQGEIKKEKYGENSIKFYC